MSFTDNVYCLIKYVIMAGLTDVIISCVGKKMVKPRFENLSRARYYKARIILFAVSCITTGVIGALLDERTWTALIGGAIYGTCEGLFGVLVKKDGA